MRPVPQVGRPFTIRPSGAQGSQAGSQGSNIERRRDTGFCVRCSMLIVRCSMFNAPRDVVLLVVCHRPVEQGFNQLITPRPGDRPRRGSRLGSRRGGSTRFTTTFTTGFMRVHYISEVWRTATIHSAPARFTAPGHRDTPWSRVILTVDAAVRPPVASRCCIRCTESDLVGPQRPRRPRASARPSSRVRGAGAPRSWSGTLKRTAARGGFFTSRCSPKTTSSRPLSSRPDKTGARCRPALKTTITTS